MPTAVEASSARFLDCARNDTIMKLDLYKSTGEKKGVLEASDTMFGAPVNAELIRLALVRQQANARRSTADTKNRAEVRGGGKKPWRQKGTGRARAGSSRSPVWPGGGVAFGPRSERNYKKRMPKQARRSALFAALSQQAAAQNVFALEAFKAPAEGGPKTKTFTALMGKLPVKRSLLVVIPAHDRILEKSAGNLPNVKTILANYLNVFDVLRYEKIMFLESAIKKAEELFL